MVQVAGILLCHHQLGGVLLAVLRGWAEIETNREVAGAEYIRKWPHKIDGIVVVQKIHG